MKQLILPLLLLLTLLCGCAQEQLSDDTISAIAQAELNGANKSEYIQNYIEQTSLKRAILIGFDTEDECKAFITEHGADENPKDAGLGSVLREQTYNGESFFNPTGTKLEDTYDVLGDGDYCGEPVYYNDKYCYFKRIGNLQTATEEQIEEIFGKEIIVEKGEEYEIDNTETYTEDYTEAETQAE